MGKKTKIDILTERVDELIDLLKSGGLPRKRLYTVKEAARYLGIGTSEIYSNLRHYVKTINHGRKLLFPVEELDLLVEHAKHKGELFY